MTRSPPSSRWTASRDRPSSSTPCSSPSEAPTATVRAVFVETDPARTAKVEEKWSRWGLGVPLVVLTSPYRSLLRPLLDYIDQIQSRGDEQMVTIVLPEFLPRKWWQHIL